MSEPAQTEPAVESVPVTATGTEAAATEPTEPAVPRLKVLADLFLKNNPSSRSCFVLGATGETGRRIASFLVESAAFEVVRLIVRRQIGDEFLPEPPSGVKIVNYKDLCKLRHMY